jgi:hypothetical protein
MRMIAILLNTSAYFWGSAFDLVEEFDPVACMIQSRFERIRISLGMPRQLLKKREMKQRFLSTRTTYGIAKSDVHFVVYSEGFFGVEKGRARGNGVFCSAF